MKGYLLTICALLHCIFAVAQQRPFPSTTVYPYGKLPAVEATNDVLEAYRTWKTNFITPCGDSQWRLNTDAQPVTLSINLGYAMVITAYLGIDQNIFDGLYKHYLQNVTSRGAGSWKRNVCDGPTIDGSDGHTDAEQEVAFALLVADKQWGSTGNLAYKTEAVRMIGIIKEFEVQQSNFIIKPTDYPGGATKTNPSYFTPAYYRVFGAVTNDMVFWKTVAEKSYEVIKNNLMANNAMGGLVSEWCRVDGTKLASDLYAVNTCRTPWHLALDYAWFGTSEAQVYCKSASDFVRVTLQGSQNVKDGYEQDGTVTGTYHTSGFTGGFASAAIAGEDIMHLNSSYTDLTAINDEADGYNQTLKTLYLIFLSGGYFNPVNIITSITHEKRSSYNLHVYPNPSFGHTTLLYQSNEEEAICVTIENLLGQEVYRKYYNTAKGTNPLTIELHGVGKGLYHVYTRSAGYKGYTKLIVE